MILPLGGLPSRHGGLPQPVSRLPMMRREPIRHVVFDLDDTVMALGAAAPEAPVQRSLLDLERQGVQLGFVTGRRMDATEPVAKALARRGNPIGVGVLNGAQTFLVYRHGGRQLVSHHPIGGPRELAQVMRWMDRHDFKHPVRLTMGNHEGEHENFFFYPPYTPRLLQWQMDNYLRRHPDKDPLLASIKVEDPATRERLAHELRQTFRHLAVNSYEGVVTLNHRQATKGDALMTLARHLNWRVRQCAAFGDAQNDISLADTLRHHGGVMVAMGNATPELKRHATHVTETLDHHGVAHGAQAIMSLNARHGGGKTNHAGNPFTLPPGLSPPPQRAPVGKKNEIARWATR